MASSPSQAADGAFTGENGHLELKDMPPRTPLPIEEDIMQLARLGEISAIQNLLESKKFGVDYQDEQGITPLHVRMLPYRSNGWRMSD